ncbi:WD repeat-containing protein 25-like [Tubulanus polymorphus]|uniref:WD repeat-containing protein 25-like n=1 Tax=Tubulanus polymorphus TaxID=672921 RepID=UPI003DA21B59
MLRKIVEYEPSTSSSDNDDDELIFHRQHRLTKHRILGLSSPKDESDSTSNPHGMRSGSTTTSATAHHCDNSNNDMDNYFGLDLPQLADSPQLNTASTLTNDVTPSDKTTEFDVPLVKRRRTVSSTSVKQIEEVIRVEVPQTDFWKSVDQEMVKEVNKKDNSTNPVDDTGSGNERHGRSHHRINDLQANKLYEYGKIQPKSNIPALGSKLSKSCDVSLNSSAPKKHIFFVHHKISPWLSKSNIHYQAPWSELEKVEAHAGAVNRIQWCSRKDYSHLLLSASMDSTVRLWNMFSSVNCRLSTYDHHSKAVKDLTWLRSSNEFISCGFDRTAKNVDIETGKVLSTHENPTYVTCLKLHPGSGDNVFVLGSKDVIHCWDKRTPKTPVKNFKYKFTFGQVQDLLFTDGGNTLFSCNDVVSRDSADRNIMAWDFRTTAVLSQQIYQEKYTCTRLKAHHSDNQLLAQSNGGYIAQFSCSRPYKLNKRKRFQGHKVLGYSIGFDTSTDGRTVISGSADGRIACYDYQTGKNFRTLDTKMAVCMDIAFHPVLPSTIAACAWDGMISVWQ